MVNLKTFSLANFYNRNTTIFLNVQYETKKVLQTVNVDALLLENIMGYVPVCDSINNLLPSF